MRRIGMGALAGMLEFLDRVRIAGDREILEKADDLLLYEKQDVGFLELLDYRTSLASFDRVRRAVNARPRIADDIRREVDHFYSRLKDELGSSYFLVLTSDEAKRFTTQRPFGGEVTEAFPSATYDIAEAANCLALGRSTASVFHLARVVETAVRRVAAELKYSIPPNPNWEHVIAPLRAELAKPPKDRSQEWNVDPAFYASVSERVMAIRDAWRNPAIHIEGKYTESEAEDIWNSVRAFMRKMADKLRETA